MAAKLDDYLDELSAAGDMKLHALVTDHTIPAEPLAILLTQSGRPISASAIRTWRRERKMKEELARG